MEGFQESGRIEMEEGMQTYVEQRAKNQNLALLW